MLDKPTTIERGVEQQLPALQRMVAALEAIAAGIGVQISSAGQGIPQANVRVVPVTNAAPVRLAVANRRRTQLTLQNLDAALDVTLGHDGAIVYGKGIRFNASVVISDDNTGVFKGEWWAIANVAGPVLIAVDDQG